ncbi:MAG: YciI family protein [Bacteroidota bacterium]
MKKTILLAALTLTFGAFSQESPYDAEMAKKVKADEYGMKQYYMVYLKAGQKRDQDSATAAAIQRGHMDNINKLADAGKLIVAGPFLDKGEVRGIFILDAASLEEAMQLTQTDPAVQSGRLIMEVHPWYGSAALMMIPELHKKVAKKEI